MLKKLLNEIILTQFLWFEITLIVYKHIVKFSIFSFLKNIENGTLLCTRVEEFSGALLIFAIWLIRVRICRCASKIEIYCFIGNTWMRGGGGGGALLWSYDKGMVARQAVTLKGRYRSFLWRWELWRCKLLLKLLTNRHSQIKIRGFLCRDARVDWHC